MEAWFNPQTAFWFSFLSLFALTATLREFAQKGRYRSAVFAIHWIVLGFGTALLLAAGIAILMQQPWYVLFPLGFSGIIILPATAWEIFWTNRKYREVEMRHSIAQDL